MAPNKKKKKPASNPARGFATTSTASKTKDNGAQEFENAVQSEVSSAPVLPESVEKGIRTEDSSNREPEKALHELTPEELESQLEDASLQNLVEIHGEKTKKSVSRQVSRIQTEKRLLRSQAEHLGIRQWLPTEIIQIITDLLQAQDNIKGSLQEVFESNKVATCLSEDDLLIKLWALKTLLSLLGFSEQRTDLALRYLLKNLNDLGPPSLSPGKDSAWGLEECLVWLALNSEPADLPSFESSERQSTHSAEKKLSELMTNTPATTPTDSRPESPVRKENPQPPQASEEDTSLTSASDLDSDAEPEDLVKNYLQLQLRLHEINPELTEVDDRRQRRGKGKNPILDGNMDSTRKRKIGRLSARINKIKSDLLFDEDKANHKWAEIRLDLVQEAAERKRLDIRNEGPQPKATPTMQSNAKLAELNDDDHDTDGMLGGFFSSLPDTATDPVTGLSVMSMTGQEGNNVEIRDFGKWTGMSPRRVLEEACKARSEFYCV